MDFGKFIRRGLDENGNVSEIEINIVDSKINYPISHTIEERKKVHNLEEEIEEYKKFSDKVQHSSDIINPAFKIEFSKAGREKGYYFVVKCYTKLERFEKP